MGKNFFENWTPEMVAAHNRRVASHENNKDHRPPPSPEPKRADGQKPLAPDGGTQKDRPRYVVRVVSFRRRLMDPDNLCAKYFVDCLRYSGLLPDDTAALVDYGVRQERVGSREEERTEIEVTEP